MLQVCMYTSEKISQFLLKKKESEKEFFLPHRKELLTVFIPKLFIVLNILYMASSPILNKIIKSN